MSPSDGKARVHGRVLVSESRSATGGVDLAAIGLIETADVFVRSHPQKIESPLFATTSSSSCTCRVAGTRSYRWNRRCRSLTGLAELIDGWVISEDVGYRKPDARIFSALAKRLGCTLDGWMIGDSVEDDIVGGSAIGLSTALIAPTGSALGEAAGAPTIISASVAEAASTILAGTHHGRTRH